MPRSDWLLIAVERCRVIGDGAQEVVAPGAQQVARRRLHLVHGHVTRIGNLSLGKRYKLWVSSVKSESL